MASQPVVSTVPDALYLSGVLVLLVRALEQRLRALAGPAALSLGELGVLGQIDRGVEGPSRIARALRLDPARVTHLVDRLVTSAYIVRESNPRDRRCCRLRLTDLGINRLKEGRGDVREAMESLLTGLTDEERAGLLHSLEGVHRVLAASPQPPAGA